MTVTYFTDNLSDTYSGVLSGADAALAQINRGPALLEQGLGLYQDRRYAQAAESWEQGAMAFASQGDRLSQAMVGSNLSLVYQKLGQWDMAQDQIRLSLDLLEDPGESFESPVRSELLGKIWNAQGQWYWSHGQFKQALEAWRQATQNYTAADHPTGIVQTRISQSKALLALGLSREAEEVLTELVRSVEQLPDTELKAISLYHLGASLRRVGELQRSRDILNRSLQLSRASTFRRSVLLELGNTERAQGDRAFAIGKRAEAEEHARESLKFYQQAADLAEAGSMRPQLNQLSLLIEIGDWSEALDLANVLEPQLEDMPDGYSSIQSRLNFAHSLTCLKRGLDLGDYTCTAREEIIDIAEPSSTPTWDQIEGIVLTALDQALTFADPIASSQALGQLGELYERQADWDTAQDLTQQALLRLERFQAPELQFRWEWQLGRLLDRQGDLEGALQFYSAAVDTLEIVRRDLFMINPDVQFSFRDNVEPVYRGLVELLLRTGGDQPDQVTLQRVIDTVDALQLAELETFLGCSLMPSIQVAQELDRIDPKAAFIYPILLSDRVAVIYKLPQQPFEYAETLIPRAEVDQVLKTHRRALVRRNAGQVIQSGTQLYQWLIQPWDRQLVEGQVRTAVFVLDGDLRNTPMAALYDPEAQGYVVEKSYALAVLPSAQLFDLGSRSPRTWEVLGAGISESIEAEGQQFGALDAESELRQATAVIPGEIRLNQAFTLSSLESDLERGDFSILHLATHGRFSSDPDETYILVHGKDVSTGELLKFATLNELLDFRNRSLQSPLELLILSACQTATGDGRAPLGLAGVAVQSGARSTIATLWEVSDSATVKFMESFYSQISSSELMMAESVHKAQLSLLNDPQFQNPYYWSSYIIVGNWS